MREVFGSGICTFGVVAYCLGMLPTCFSLIVAVAGWYYMFYSRTASALAGIEGARLNRMRAKLRRVGGGSMFLLAVFFFAGFYAVDADHPGVGFYWIWTIVLFLLVAIVVLGVTDLLMTRRLSRRNHV